MVRKFELFCSTLFRGPEANIHEQSKIAGAPIGRDKWPIKYGDDARNPSFYNF